MKVILKEDLPKLGRTGDIVTVSDGYGRNYLLPRGLADLASSRSLKEVEHQKKVIQARLERQRQESQDLARRLETVTCTLARRVGEEDKLFGSVTARDIEGALQSHGIVVDRRKILLEEPIKRLGEYTVPVKLHPEVTGMVKVIVVAE